MDSLGFVKSYLLSSLDVTQKLVSDEKLIKKIRDIAELLVQMYSRGNKLLIAGNGGSAGDAQHIAAEFVSRFYFDRPGLPAIALSTDTSILTAIGNDYGFKKIFARQVQAQGKAGDIFIGISTSGNSENIISAINEAKSLGITTIALCGTKGAISDMADHVLSVPSSSTPHIQECHIVISHVICGLVENIMFTGAKQNV